MLLLLLLPLLLLLLLRHDSHDPCFTLDAVYSSKL
jgi:hypothetical protein